MQVVGIAPGPRSDLFDRVRPCRRSTPAGRHFRTGTHLHLRVARGGAEAEAAALAALRQELRAADDRLPALTLSTMQRFHDRGLGLWGVRMGGGC